MPFTVNSYGTGTATIDSTCSGTSAAAITGDNVNGFTIDGLRIVNGGSTIYGVLLAAAIMFPDRQIWLIPFPVTIPMKIYVAGAIAIEFFSTLGTGGDNVSHVTHLGGALVGYLYLRRGLFLYRMRNDYLDWKRRRARRKFEVYMRDHKNEPPGSSDDRWVN